MALYVFHEITKWYLWHLWMSAVPRVKPFYIVNEEIESCFFFGKSNTRNFMCTFTSDVWHSRRRLPFFPSSVDLLVWKQRLYVCFSWIFISSFFFSFCYRLVKTYVQKNISVFNKSNGWNLFLSTHIILVRVCFWRNIGWGFRIHEMYGKYVQAIKLIKTILFVCSLRISVIKFCEKKFCQKAIKQPRLFRVFMARVP